jgi:hypothetical protein
MTPRRKSEDSARLTLSSSKPAAVALPSRSFRLKFLSEAESAKGLIRTLSMLTGRPSCSPSLFSSWYRRIGGASRNPAIA